MNIVLDTNCLIMSIAPSSMYRRVWQAFLNGEYTLCVTNEIIEEYAEVLARNISQRVSEAIIYAILTRRIAFRHSFCCPTPALYTDIQQGGKSRPCD